MATTDALSVAMKQLGVAADVYMGLSDSKYDKKEDIKMATGQQKSTLKDIVAKLPDDHKGVTVIMEALGDKYLSTEKANKMIKRGNEILEELSNIETDEYRESTK